MICCLWLTTAYGQTPSYLHYSVREGLPGNNVYCGTQDKRGLLWFGTDKGLSCFDGMRFRTYGMEDGLPDLEVLNMKEDSRGRLWLSCFRKKVCYMSGGRIITAQQDSLLASIDLRSGVYIISEDSVGGIWHTEFKTKAYYLYQNTLRRHDFPGSVSTIASVGGDLLAFGDSKIMLLTPGAPPKIVYSIPWTSGGLISFTVSGNRILYSSNQSTLLEWSNGKIRVLDTLSKSFGRVFTDKAGRFWICSQSVGAICFDNPNKDLSNPVAFLPDKKVTAMFEDAQGTTWFCTTDEGIFALPQNTPVTYNEQHLPSRNIRSIAGDHNGPLYFGDDLGNVHFINNGILKTLNINTSDGFNQVRQIKPTGKGALLVGADDGLYYSAGDNSPVKTLIHNVSLKSFWAQPDKVWFASATQLGYYHLARQKWESVIFDRFTATTEDHEGNIWAGRMEGLYCLSDSFQTNWGDFFPELKSRITVIRRAGKNNLWVATPESGLLLVSVRSGAVTNVEVINRRLKKNIRNIQSLYVDPAGRTWMATNTGVYGLTRDYKILHFGTHDGLADDDVNAVFARNDTLWAGTAAGLTRIILQMPREHGDFATFITGLRFEKNNQSVFLHLLDSLPDRHYVNLPPEAAALELELAGLDYRSRGNLQFEVSQTDLLLPFRWWTIDNLLACLSAGFRNTQKSYMAESPVHNLGTYLPAGRYLFRVTAVQASGIRSLHPDVWVLTKLPRWYETFWFYLALWSLLGYGAWRVFQARRAFQDLHTTASIMQLQALQSQMNPHFIGNAVNAIQQFLHPPDPVKSSEYISVFMRLLRRTMLFSEKTFITFGEELAYDLEYLKLVELRFAERVRIEISGDAEIPPDTPIPGMLLQPLLENATMHGLAPEGISVIRLDFSFDKKQFQCVLTDNGIGFKESQKLRQQSGLKRESKGLEMLRKKIDTLNRLYDLDLLLVIRDRSDEGAGQQGTHLTLTYSPGKIWTALNK